MTGDFSRFVPVTSAEQIERTAQLASVVWHECYARILPPVQIDYMVNNMQSTPAITRHIAEENYRYYLLYVGDAPDDEPSGYIAIQRSDKKLLLSKLYILAEFRGRGHAKEALAFVEELGREDGCDGIWLTVNRYNERAIAVYRKTGFTQVRQQETDIGGGFVMDDFIFEKPI